MPAATWRSTRDWTYVVTVLFLESASGLARRLRPDELARVTPELCKAFHSGDVPHENITTIVRGDLEGLPPDL